MPQLELLLVSESLSIDQATNEVSAFGILEELNAVAFPATVPRVSVLSIWRPEAGDVDKDWQMVLRVTTPGDQPIELPTNFRFSAEARRHRLAQGILGLTVSREGNVRFELFLNRKPVEERLVPVRLVTPGELPGQVVLATKPPATSGQSN